MLNWGHPTKENNSYASCLTRSTLIFCSTNEVILEFFSILMMEQISQESCFKRLLWNIAALLKQIG